MTDSESFANLPLFATDRQLAAAIVGKDRATEWLRTSFPIISKRPGFPPLDPFHKGWPVPLVRMFYDNYIGIASAAQAFAATPPRDKEANLEV